MSRKTLIINGSPRLKGDTAALVAELKKHLTGEVVEISAYRSRIAPCVDCRSCQKTGQCVVKDDMSLIYADDYDNVVLASPIYYMTLPGPVLSLMSRFQPQHAVKLYLREKKAGVIQVAGGKGNEAGAFHHTRVLFRMMNAKGFEEHTVKSVKTDLLPAAQDAEALEGVRKLAEWLNEE